MPLWPTPGGASAPGSTPWPPPPSPHMPAKENKNIKVGAGVQVLGVGGSYH